MVNSRIKDLQPAVTNDEPLRKGEAGSGSPGSYTPRRIQTVSGATGSVAIDWSLYDEVRLNLSGDVTLSFSGAVDGQGCTLKLKQDGTGSRVVTLPGTVRFNEDVTTFVASTLPNKSDRIGLIYDNGDSFYDFVSVIKGF